MKGEHSHVVDDFMLRDKRDFADVIKVANWMALISSKGKLSGWA